MTPKNLRARRSRAKPKAVYEVRTKAADLPARAMPALTAFPSAPCPCAHSFPRAMSACSVSCPMPCPSGLCRPALFRNALPVRTMFHRKKKTRRRKMRRRGFFYSSRMRKAVRTGIALARSENFISICNPIFPALNMTVSKEFALSWKKVGNCFFMPSGEQPPCT